MSILDPFGQLNQFNMGMANQCSQQNALMQQAILMQSGQWGNAANQAAYAGSRYPPHEPEPNPVLLLLD